MRAAILKKAEQQLMSGGFDKLNFASIAAELKTTRANLHYHFKNKETLAIEVTSQYGNRCCNEFSAMRAAFKGNFIGFFAAMDQSFWDKGQREDDSRVCVTLAADPELPEPLVKLSQEFYSTINGILESVLQDAVDNKEISSETDVKREATRAHVIMMGMMMSAMHMSDPERVKQQLGGILTEWANSLE